MFVVIEGGDACGKHTLTQSLIAKYVSEGVSVHAYSFPQYSTPLGRDIQRWLTSGLAAKEPFAFQSMMTADRYSVANEIKELAADKDVLVISDRWWQSGFVYGHAVGLDHVFLRDIHKSLPLADLNILLELSAEKAGARRPEKRDIYEKNAELMERVSVGYRKLWEGMAEVGLNTWRVLDASLPKETVFEMTCSMIDERRGRG